MSKEYEHLPREALIDLLKRRDSQGSYGLVWERNSIEKDQALNRDFVGLELDPTLSCGPAPWRNLIISMKKLLAASIALLCVGASADMFNPEHDCRKPFKPYEFKHQWQVDTFKRDVATYEQCIEQFVEEQRLAARRHNEAANQAIQDFNSYLKSLR